MGCFFETAKKRNHCNNNNNDNSNSHTENNSFSSKQQLATTSSSTTTATTTTTKVICDDSIIFKNKDINKDNNQQNPNKTYTNIAKDKEQAIQAKQEAARKHEENSVGAATAIAAVKNTQQFVKDLLKLRQQQQQHEHENNNVALEVERQEQEHEKKQQLENETAENKEEETEAATLTLLNNKLSDLRYSQNTATSYCLYPRLKRRTTHDNNNHKISNCCHSTGSSWHQTLYSKKPPQQQQQLEPRYDAATYCQVAAGAARNMAVTMAATACATSNNLPEMLLHARHNLAAYLTQASHCFMENLSNCCAAASTPIAAATTTTTTTAAYPAIKTKQREQQRQQHRRHCWHREQQQQQQQLHRSKCTHFQAHFDGLREQQSHSSSKNNNNEHCDHSCSAYSYNYSHYNNNNINNNTNNNNNYYNTLRNSISFYAASSVILVLCYLTTTTSAAATNTNAAAIDKHPIQGIDWSKFDESSSDKEILDLLLEKKRYDKRLLPPVNDEDFCCGLSSPDMAIDKSSTRSHNRGTLTVNVNVLLLSLASPDESSLKYEVEFLLNQQWNDPRLQYGNKSQYEYLNALHHHDNIWTPDTYFIMHGDFKDPIIPMHFALRIYRNGTITYAMRRHLILSCQGSLHIFPFDDPKCSFSMESISYEEAQIKYVWKNDEDTLRKSPSLTTLNAYLIKNQTTPCDQNSWRGNYSCLRVDLIFTRDRAFYFTTVFIPGIILVTSSFITFWLEWNAVPARSMIGNYSCLQVELTFTRDRAYYFTTVFIPGIILVTSSFITFWLEWNAVPARVMIGVTTMLNFFTTSNGFRSTLPVVSNLTAMNVWDGVCMCFIYASLLEFVCVNYVGRKRPLHNVVYRPGENPVTQRLPAVLSRIGVILASPLEIIEREFHAALSSEKAAAGISSVGSSLPHTAATASPDVYPSTPAATTTTKTTSVPTEQQHGSIIGAAVQNLRARSVKYRRSQTKDVPENIYMEPIFMEPAAAAAGPIPTVTMEDESSKHELAAGAQIRRSQSMSTNTPPLILRDEKIRIDVHFPDGDGNGRDLKAVDIDETERQLPTKPPRKKPSRSTSPVGVYFMEIVGDNRRRDTAGRLVGGEGGGGGGVTSIANEIIEREFHAALSSEKAAAGISSVGSSLPHTAATASPDVYPSTPAATTTTKTTSVPTEQQHGSIIGAAVQNLRARSVKYRRSQTKDVPENIYMEPIFMEPAAAAAGPIPTVTMEDESSKHELAAGAQIRRSQSMSTNTPPLILRDEKIRIDVHFPDGDGNGRDLKAVDIDETERQLPTKPPRKKPSRSTSPVGVYFMEIVGDNRRRDTAGRLVGGEGGGGGGVTSIANGDKRREASAPNEIVACTSCGGGNSPCTHSANNGCATETCFVQVRKKEPPHPIRVAKTIDVIARITFPTAYSIFLIFFFVHYKGFS